MTRPGSGTTSKSAPCTGSPGGRTDTTSTQDRETALRLSVWSRRFNGTFLKTGWSPSAVCLPLQARMPPIPSIRICPSFGCGTRAGRLPCDSPSRASETGPSSWETQNDQTSRTLKQSNRRFDSRSKGSALDLLRSSFTIPKSCRLSARRRHVLTAKVQRPRAEVTMIRHNCCRH